MPGSYSNGKFKSKKYTTGSKFEQVAGQAGNVVGDAQKYFIKGKKKPTRY